MRTAARSASTARFTCWSKRAETFAADRTRVFVPNTQRSSIDVYARDSGARVHSFSASDTDAARALSAHNGELFVVNPHSSIVCVVDADSGKRLREFDVQPSGCLRPARARRARTRVHRRRPPA